MGGEEAVSREADEIRDAIRNVLLQMSDLPVEFRSDPIFERCREQLRKLVQRDDREPLFVEIPSNQS